MSMVYSRVMEVVLPGPLEHAAERENDFIKLFVSKAITTPSAYEHENML